MKIDYKIASSDDFLALAKLRIEVFHDFPYLYDGNFEYEKAYLETYAKSPSSRIFLALDGEKVIGASTCIPLEYETAEVIDPLVTAGYSTQDVMYFGESVLKAEYRGQGVGVKFFELREEYAKSLGRKWTTFCGVIRPENHVLKPVDHKPLDEFWGKRGYKAIKDCKAKFKWLDRGEKEDSVKELQFWIKKLS